MFFNSLIAFSFLSLSIARTLPIAKRDPSSHWWSGLESYSTYHTRYLELDCENKHNSSFFTQCCHPRLKDTDLSQIPEQCLGSDDVCDDNDNNNGNSPTQSLPPVNAGSDPTVSSSVSAPSPTHSSSSSSGGDDSGDSNVRKGTGRGTFYYQNGNAGACGQYHSDSDKVVALDSAIYGNGKYCGKTIHITNTSNGKTVKATVADECPTCVSSGSVDMSVGTFTEIALESTGDIPISWVLDL